MLYLARSFNAENALLSDMTCTGLQLANFWQDVARDLAIGRVYLPREDRLRFGYPDADLHELKFTPAFASLLKFEVGRARTLLEQGHRLALLLPRDIAVDVDLFSRGGLAILDRIESQDFDVLTSRPRLGKLAKLGLLARALLLRPKPMAGSAAPIASAMPAPRNGHGRKSPSTDRPGRGTAMNEALRASYQFCGTLSRKEAKNFYYSFLVLPAPLRRSMCALYAFLRHTDDLADEPALALEQRARLDAWRQALDRALAGGSAAEWPGLLALADTVERHAIPDATWTRSLTGSRWTSSPLHF